MAFHSSALASELDLYVEKLTQDFEDELQSEGHLLSGVFETDSQDGDFIKIDRIGARDSVKIKTSILEPLTYSSDTFEERLCGYETFWDAAITDPDEIIRMAKDPTSAKKKNMMRDFGRRIDRFLVNKFTEAVSIRAAGAVTTLSFANDGGITIAVNDHAFRTPGSTAGTNDICLTPGKLKKATKTLLANFTSLEDIFVLSNSNQLMLLKTHEETHNGDFRTGRPLESKGFGGLNGYLGLNYIAIDDPLALPADVNTDEPVYVVARSALQVRQPKGLNVIIDQDPNIVEKPHRIQVVMRLGAVRKDGKKIVKILCDATTNIPA